MSKRILGLLLVLLSGTIWISRWTESEGRRFDQNTRWGEIPPSPALLTSSPESVFYQVKIPSPVRSLSRLPEPLPDFSKPIEPTAAAAPIPQRPAAAEPLPVSTRPPMEQVQPEGDPLQQWLEAVLPALLEGTLPVFVQTAMDRLNTYMEAAGETQLNRRFTQEELDREILRAVERRSRGQVTDLTARIQAGALSGSGTLCFGPQKFAVTAKVSVKVIDQKPHVILHQIRVGSRDLSEPALHRMEHQINRFIDAQRYPLVLKEFRVGSGSVWMRVEQA